MEHALIVETLGGATMTSNYRLAELAGKIGLKKLFSQADWVQEVNAYILDNKDECTVVWDAVRAQVDLNAQK